MRTVGLAPGCLAALPLGGGEAGRAVQRLVGEQGQAHVAAAYAHVAADAAEQRPDRLRRGVPAVGEELLGRREDGGFQQEVQAEVSRQPA